MTTKHDWRSQSSEDAKLIVIGKAWGTEVDTYLWYEIGDISRLTDDETTAIITEFFIKGKADFGDIELHKNGQIPGQPTLLRLRAKLVLKPAITLRNHRYCPLYQVGHSSDKDCINFFELWEKSA